MNGADFIFAICWPLVQLLSVSCDSTSYLRDHDLHMQIRGRRLRDTSQEEIMKHRNITNFQILDNRRELEVAYIIDSLENLGILSPSKTSCYMVHRIVREVLPPRYDHSDDTRIIVQMEFYEKSSSTGNMYPKSRDKLDKIDPGCIAKSPKSNRPSENVDEKEQESNNSTNITALEDVQRTKYQHEYASGGLSHTQVLVISTCTVVIGLFFIVALILRIRNYLKRVREDPNSNRRSTFRFSDNSNKLCKSDSLADKMQDPRLKDLLIDIERPTPADSTANSPISARGAAGPESHPLLVVTAASAPPSPRSSEEPEVQTPSQPKKADSVESLTNEFGIYIGEPQPKQETPSVPTEKTSPPSKQNDIQESEDKPCIKFGSEPMLSPEKEGSSQSPPEPCSIKVVQAGSEPMLSPEEPWATSREILTSKRRYTAPSVAWMDMLHHVGPTLSQTSINSINYGNPPYMYGNQTEYRRNVVAEDDHLLMGIGDEDKSDPGHNSWESPNTSYREESSNNSQILSKSRSNSDELRGITSEQIKPESEDKHSMSQVEADPSIFPTVIPDPITDLPTLIEDSNKGVELPPVQHVDNSTETTTTVLSQPVEAAASAAPPVASDLQPIASAAPPDVSDLHLDLVGVNPDQTYTAFPFHDDTSPSLPEPEVRQSPRTSADKLLDKLVRANRLQCSDADTGDSDVKKNKLLEQLDHMHSTFL